MDNNVNKIIGCSFDGLKDRFFIYGEDAPQGTDFFLADVVLPSRSGGGLLAGDDAERARVSSGLLWPPEAQVKLESDYHLRRVPVSWAWRLLVDAKDKYATWKSAPGVSFDISRILAAHIATRLGAANKSTEDLVIAIPNDLDEFGQDKLIRALRKEGIGTLEKRPRLLWRPVAAALTWLSKVQDKFSHPINKEDFILVVHIGPDCIEFTTFRLREKKYEDRCFVIPLRELPQVVFSISGCDWVTEFIRQTFNIDEPGAIWQGFTNFPEIWEALSQRPWSIEELPRVWGVGGAWELWNPEENCRDKIWQIKVVSSEILESLTKNNCTHTRPNLTFHSWKKFLQEGVLKSIAVHKVGRLRGIILSGPIASAYPNVWLKEIEPLLEKRGFKMSVSHVASIDSVWVPNFEEDIISEGAAIYGLRLSKGEPTYLDTLPQLFILADKRGEPDWVWVALLKSDNLEIEGGKEHRNCIEKEFSLKRASKDLEVWLKKNEEKVFKKSIFRFPYAPEKTVLLDIDVRMSPASGLAQVELIPEDKQFLAGDRVFIDYDNMKEENKCPKKKLRFPFVIDHNIDEDDYRLFDTRFKYIWENFLNVDVHDQKYAESVGTLRREISKQRRRNYRSTQYGRVVNKDGKTRTSEGQIIINNVAQKLGNDFGKILEGAIDRRYVMRERIIRHVYFASTWLLGATPDQVVYYIRKRLNNKISGTIYVDHALREQFIADGAARCFVESDDIVLIYRAAIDRIYRVNTSYYDYNPFPIYWSRAIWRVLLWREFAPDAMEGRQAITFLKQALSKALNNMENPDQRRRFSQSFFQSIKMIVCLLRFRIKDPEFLSPHSEEDKDCFNEILHCLESAINYFQRRRFQARNIRAANLLKEIRKYMEGEGTDKNIINAINVFAGEELDDTE